MLAPNKHRDRHSLLGGPYDQQLTRGWRGMSSQQFAAASITLRERLVGPVHDSDRKKGLHLGTGLAAL